MDALYETSTVRSRSSSDDFKHTCSGDGAGFKAPPPPPLSFPDSAAEKTPFLSSSTNLPLTRADSSHSSRSDAHASQVEALAMTTEVTGGRGPRRFSPGTARAVVNLARRRSSPKAHAVACRVGARGKPGTGRENRERVCDPPTLGAPPLAFPNRIATVAGNRDDPPESWHGHLARHPSVAAPRGSDRGTGFALLGDRRHGTARPPLNCAPGAASSFLYKSTGGNPQHIGGGRAATPHRADDQQRGRGQPTAGEVTPLSNEKATCQH
ncbi:unnamed protein product [Lampetra fluviatilis]